MQTPAYISPVKRKLPTWAWLLIGCGGAAFLTVVLLMVVGGVMVYKTINANPESRFFFTIQTGNLDGVRKQLDENPKLVNGSEKTATSPLAAAALSGNQEMVKLLLARGADVNATAKSGGTTPLHEVAPMAIREIMQLLVDHGAKVNATDSSGDTPLHLAAQMGNDEAAEVLIAAGANVNAKNKAGTRPLSNAREINAVMPPFAKKMLKFASKQQGAQRKVHFPTDESYKKTQELLVKHGAKE